VKSDSMGLAGLLDVSHRVFTGEAVASPAPTVTRRPSPSAEPRGQDRPRLLSYVGRWGRARRWLGPDVGRVLDVGCAFGYGTAALTGRGRSRWRVIGLERDRGLVELAAKQYPWIPLVQADAAALPFGSGTMDAVVALDVVEHMANPALVFAEARRVLRSGGYLLLTMPHQGLLAALDANNRYTSLRRRRPSLPPLEPYDDSTTGQHRHFRLDEVRSALGAGFVVDRVARTGLGVAELLHLPVLIAFKALLRWQGAYLTLRSLHFYSYLVEDFLPAGPFGYHLTILARAVGDDRPGSTARSSADASAPALAGVG
jgi:SAM-dependent methyltransferase